MEIEYTATCLSTEEEILRSDIRPIKVKTLVLPTGLEIEAVIESGT